MMEEQESHNEKKVTNIVLQDDGIHDSTYPHEEKEPEEKVASEQIERRKALMKKIKNRIVDDF